MKHFWSKILIYSSKNKLLFSVFFYSNFLLQKNHQVFNFFPRCMRKFSFEGSSEFFSQNVLTFFASLCKMRLNSSSQRSLKIKTNNNFLIYDRNLLAFKIFDCLPIIFLPLKLHQVSKPFQKP